MNGPRNQILSLLKSGRPREIVLQETHRQKETRALEK
jgi:hypothetical protein